MNGETIPHIADWQQQIFDCLKAAYIETPTPTTQARFVLATVVYKDLAQGHVDTAELIAGTPLAEMTRKELRRVTTATQAGFDTSRKSYENTPVRILEDLAVSTTPPQPIIPRTRTA